MMALPWVCVVVAAVVIAAAMVAIFRRTPPSDTALMQQNLMVALGQGSDVLKATVMPTFVSVVRQDKEHHETVRHLADNGYEGRVSSTVCSSANIRPGGSRQSAQQSGQSQGTSPANGVVINNYVYGGNGSVQSTPQGGGQNNPPPAPTQPPAPNGGGQNTPPPPQNQPPVPAPTPLLVSGPGEDPIRFNLMVGAEWKIWNQSLAQGGRVTGEQVEVRGQLGANDTELAVPKVSLHPGTWRIQIKSVPGGIRSRWLQFDVPD